jgi:hypothetical protein
METVQIDLLSRHLLGPSDESHEEMQMASFSGAAI